MVGPVNDSWHIVACRSGDQDSLGACVQMSLGFFLGCESSGAFQYYVNAVISPWKSLRIALPVYLDSFAVNSQGSLIVRNVVVVAVTSLNAVILEQMRDHLRFHSGVDCYYLNAVFFEHGSEGQSSDPSETVNCYSHFVLLSHLVALYF